MQDEVPLQIGASFLGDSMPKWGDCRPGRDKSGPYMISRMRLGSPLYFHIRDNTPTLKTISFSLKREHALQGNSGPERRFTIDSDLVNYLVLDETL